MRWRSMIALALVTGWVASGTAAAQDTRPGVGIFAFENGGSYGQEAEDFQALQVGLQQMLIGDLSGNSGLRLVERGQIQQLLEEQELGAGGRVDANTAAQIGRLIGARYMIFGSFIDFYGDFRLDARIIDGETGEVIKTDRARGPREDLFSILQDLADNIPDGLDLPALSARDRQTRQENRERLGQANSEAVRAYMRGLLYQDRGDNERAAELFSQAIDAFPDYHEAREALNQVSE
ncbi:CsgG/HfaB family protein [Gemmatimonadota bacterium]